MRLLKWSVLPLLLCLLLCCPLSAAAKINLEDVTIEYAAAVHIAPKERSAVIGYLLKGTPVTVLGEENGFYRIDCYDMTGYLAKTLVSGNTVDFDEAQTDVTAFAAQPMHITLDRQSVITQTGLPLQGVPYVTAGSTPRGFDCSGLTQYLMADVNISLKRTCGGQMAQGIIIPKDALQCGDLIFFQNTTEAWALTTHVGIYLGDGKLLHAGTRGVAVVELDNPYYTEHYLCARRYFLTADPVQDNDPQQIVRLVK